MLKSVSAASVAAVAAAALVASLAAASISVVPEAKADLQFTSTLGQPQAVGSLRPAAMEAAACPLRGWPHYDQACQFDLRRPANDARPVRIIAQR